MYKITIEIHGKQMDIDISAGDATDAIKLVEKSTTYRGAKIINIQPLVD